MESPLWGVPAALWLGILTSISPCPLAANVAAISFIARRVDDPRRALATGLLYTAGRTLAYAALGAVVVAGLLSIPALARSLQATMNKVFGPLLIIAGLLLLEWVRPVVRAGDGLAARARGRADRAGPWGAGLLGLISALTFCPVSAALFFGSLIPLAVQHRSSVALPTVYGVGTGLPVFAFAVLLVLGARAVARAFDRLAALEKWARRATGVVFIGAGTWYVLTYLLGVL